MDALTVQKQATVPVGEKTVKNCTYKSGRTTYAVQSTFTDKILLTDAFYRIALSKLKET